MEQFIHYLSSSWTSIKRAPLPYALTVLIMSLGLGVFFSNATFYYWMQHDPLPHKSDKLFFPRIASYPFDCGQCDAPVILSYRDVQKLSNTNIPTAMAAMFNAAGYVRADEQGQASLASIRFTQKDFFTLFDVPIMQGQVWPDNKARMEVIISRAFAKKIFGKTDVVGQPLLLNDNIYKVVAVMDKWQMLPKLYDVNAGNFREPVEDVYLPLEVAYDLNFIGNHHTQTFEIVNQRKLATEGREKAYHRLQFWVQLDTPEQQQNYREFMRNLVADEKAAGRHPSMDFSRLDPMSNILKSFHIESAEILAYALVTLLFLVVCLFNASHLSLNRYLANQFEFSLRRALGASSGQLQIQLLADVFISSAFSIILAAVISWLGIFLINYLLPGNQVFAQWNWQLAGALVCLGLFCNYLVALYPALRTAFGNLSLQLKS